jgi:REP element-mobilizing transposase RayT
MARPLRLEFPGATYHVTSRGDRREAIYRDDADRALFLQVLEKALDRFNAQVLAYCLMGNHYHLVLHTRLANLSRLMRQLNGVYTQTFNRRHALVGHLFQGRFKAILVDRDLYLLALCRYVERNPVAAGLVRSPGQWPWSSYRAHVRKADAPAWLDCEGLHGYLLGRTPMTTAERDRAGQLYAASVVQDASADAGLWSNGLRQQVFLGDADFVERMMQHASSNATQPDGVPKRQTRRLPRSDAPPQALPKSAQRAALMRSAYTESGWTMTKIAQANGISVSRVSRLIASVERVAKGKT